MRSLADKELKTHYDYNTGLVRCKRQESNFITVVQTLQIFLLSHWHTVIRARGVRSHLLFDDVISRLRAALQLLSLKDGKTGSIEITLQSGNVNNPAVKDLLIIRIKD